LTKKNARKGRSGGEKFFLGQLANCGSVVTKGDANNMEDRKPVPYDAVIGRVEQHIPVFGMAMDIYASAIGKVYLLLTAGCGLMLCMIATSMEERNAANAA
jgi:hypothetical protein